jgi:hypothetical protein
VINDQKLLKFIDHVETRLEEIAKSTRPINVEVKASNPAIVNGELLTFNQMLRHEGKPYDRVKAAESDLIAAQKKLAVKQKRYDDAKAELVEAERKVGSLTNTLADEREFHRFANLGK